jgi:hypothetical protein
LIQELANNWIFVGLFIISVGVSIVAYVAVEQEEGAPSAFAAALVALCILVGLSIVVVVSTGWGM